MYTHCSGIADLPAYVCTYIDASVRLDANTHTHTHTHVGQAELEISKKQQALQLQKAEHAAALVRSDLEHQLARLKQEKEPGFNSPQVSVCMCTYARVRACVRACVRA